MSSNRKPPSADPEAARLEPNVREHGENGYAENAVGGFGESYAHQVAHGGDSESPAMPSDSELDANPAVNVSGALAHAVRTTLARAHVDAADLLVEAKGSEIHLRGSVRHPFEKAELEARALSVPGVSSVVNELAVLHAGWQENT
jgi:osmotically-inducible protein OsmY